MDQNAVRSMYGVGGKTCRKDYLAHPRIHQNAIMSIPGSGCVRLGKDFLAYPWKHQNVILSISSVSDYPWERLPRPSWDAPECDPEHCRYGQGISLERIPQNPIVSIAVLGGDFWERLSSLS